MSQGELAYSDIPPIYVSSPDYDDMGAILDRLGISYTDLDMVDLSMANGGVVMLNCSFSWRDEVDLDALEQFIADGGTMMASDLTSDAIEYFTSATFGSGGWGNSVPAEVVDPELVDLLGQETLELDFDTAIHEPESLPAGSTPLLEASDRNSVIAYKFSYHRGTVVYTVFHNHSQPTDVEDALLQALLMVPIAESANTTVEDTYTTIVGDPSGGSDTQLLDESGNTTEVYRQASGGSETGIRTETNRTTVTLRTVTGGSGELSRTLAAGDSVQLGRDELGGIVADQHRSYISGRHFEIQHPESHGPLKLRDIDSTNGTVLAGEDISDGRTRSLETGMRLTLAGDRVTLEIDV
jgi:pSer/pThr/pTyr-binding forkhead associated (FHA) protein